ncbi:MAG: hypothetical protein ACLFNT_06710, partial [Spirochaetales bacterium]
MGLNAWLVESWGYVPYEGTDIWTYVLSFLKVIIPVAGTIYAYQRNGGRNGTGFAKKFFSIGFVIGIRFLVCGVPL